MASDVENFFFFFLAWLFVLHLKGNFLLISFALYWLGCLGFFPLVLHIYIYISYLYIFSYKT